MHRVDDDSEFLERCETAAVPREDWNHEARVRMAYLVLQRGDFAAAIGHVRRIILRANSRHGVANSGSRGYHETLTLAWMRVIAAAMGASSAAGDFEAFIAERPELLRKERILSHYSRERILTARARREFVLPDRDPLPQPGPLPAAPPRTAAEPVSRGPAADLSPTATGALLAATYG